MNDDVLRLFKNIITLTHNLKRVVNDDFMIHISHIYFNENVLISQLTL